MKYLIELVPEGRIKIESPAFACLISSFDYLENCNRCIFNHGWVNFPLGKKKSTINYVNQPREEHAHALQKDAKGK